MRGFIAFGTILIMGALGSYGQTFREIGPVDVKPGEAVIIQIEDGTPVTAENRNYVLELDTSVHSAIVMRSTIDGRVSPLRPEDEVILKINVTQAGTYYLFANCASNDGSSDSFFVGIDGDVDNDNWYRFNLGPDDGRFHVQWVTSHTLGDVVEYPLDAGLHEINWHVREPNSRVDWVGITDNPNLNLAQIQEPGPRPSIITAERQLDSPMFRAGGTLSVTLTATNIGETPASGTLVETPPSGWTIGDVTGGGTVADGTITWAVENLAGGDSLTVGYTVAIPSDFSQLTVEFRGHVTTDIGDISTSGASLVLSEPIDLGIFDGHMDIGSVGAEGGVARAGDDWAVIGSGADIWGTADGFHYLYKRVSGDFKMTIENASIGPIGANPTGNDWAKMGIMARQSLTPGSAYAFAMFRMVDQAFMIQWREAEGVDAEPGFTDDSAVYPTDTGVGGCCHHGTISLERRGDDFFISFVDETGTEVEWDAWTVVMQDPIYLGVAVTSHQTGATGVGLFSNPKFTGTAVPILFSLSRELPGTNFVPGQPVQGVKVTADIREGQSVDLTITETPPAGWTVSSLSPSVGSAEVDAAGNIVWSITGATGSPTLTYDVTPPAGATKGEWSGSGSGAGDTFAIQGPTLMISSQAITVYFIGGGDPTLPRNTVYTDLLSDGLTLIDANGQEVTIPGLNYLVTYVDEGADNPAEAVAYNLVIAHESAYSGNVEQYINQPVPYLVIEQVLAAGRADRAAGLWFCPQDAISLPDGEWVVQIIDNTHPITQLYEPDQELEITLSVDAEVSGIAPDALAPAATPLAITGMNVGPERVVLAVADEGATGFVGNADAPVPAGADPAPARRAFLGYHERVQVYVNAEAGIENISITPAGAILFQRVAQWTIGLPVTADGTPEGAQLPPPPVPVEEWSIY